MALNLCDLPLEMLRTIWVNLPSRDLVAIMCVSVRLQQSVSRYDLQRRKWLASTVNELALQGDVEGVKYLWGRGGNKQTQPPPPLNSTWAMVNACRFGHLDVVKFLCERINFSIHEFNVACAYGNLEVVEFLFGRRHTHKMQVRGYMEREDGQQNELNMYNYDLEGYEGDDTDETNAMDGAAQNGQLAVVQFLHKVGMPYTTCAMDFAAGDGHLHVVQYLHSVGANCTSNAIDHASRMGFLRVVEFLLLMGKPHSVWAIDYACANGHVDILRLFHRLGKLEILCGACAALNENQLGVLQFLNQVGVLTSDPTTIQKLVEQALRMDTFIKPETKEYICSLLIF